MKISCIAIDDEPLALEKIREYIKRIGYLELLETFDNAVDALEFIKTTKVDLIFLDIQMKELTGIQMIETMQTKHKIILTTAYDEYALKGYDLDICDYLLKPISFQRFLQAAEKAYSQIQPNIITNESLISSKSDDSPLDYFFIKNGHIIQKIIFNDILFVEGVKDYLRIWTISEKPMTLLSFKKLAEALPDNGFIRIHKSYLISIDKIERIEQNHVQIGDHKLPIGGNYRKDFLKIIEEKKLN